ncbi:MAG: flagellar basal body rod protein FlgC [Planctomycetota bacterium]|nr:MAG: flagellar basal body rod protein FlgC [Planctomycetota bacterium]
MAGSTLFSGIETPISGMAAERLRMRVIAGNIANANTISDDGTPYQRKYVRFAEVLHGQLVGNKVEAGGGVRVDGVEVDQVTPHAQVYDPSHPAADGSGFVKRPNVDIMHEMVDMMIAKRSFGANIAAFRNYRAMLKEAIQQIGVS